MLDIKFIRENKDIVAAGAKKKHITVDIERLLDLDDQRRGLQMKYRRKAGRAECRVQRYRQRQSSPKSAKHSSRKMTHVKEDARSSKRNRCRKF